jgi:hypothetical protein
MDEVMLYEQKKRVILTVEIWMFRLTTFYTAVASSCWSSCTCTCQRCDIRIPVKFSLLICPVIPGVYIDESSGVNSQGLHACRRAKNVIVWWIHVEFTLLDVLEVWSEPGKMSCPRVFKGCTLLFLDTTNTGRMQCWPVKWMIYQWSFLSQT